jgi:hypothetical protein
MDLFNLWKQLPDLDIVNQDQDQEHSNSNYDEGYDTEPWPMYDDKPTEEKPIEMAPTVSAAAASEVTEKQEGKDGEGWKLLKCPTCSKSFYNNFTLSAHECLVPDFRHFPADIQIK